MPERHRILIVDDDAQDRQAVRQALRRETAGLDDIEAEVLEAETLARAREALAAEEFACLFLDHDLPDGSGLDLLQEVRAQGLATPVIILTGRRSDDAVLELMHAGAADYLPKDGLHPELVGRSLRAALRFLQAQREKQAALAEVHARDRALAATANGVVIADPHQPDCPLVYANPAFLQMTGYTEAEVIGRNCRFLQGPDTDPAAVRELHEAIQSERPCQVLILNYRKDGTSFWNEVTVSPVRDVRGRLTHFVGVQTDTTARHEADGERTRLLDLATRQAADLTESERRYRTVIASLEEGVLLQDGNGVLQTANASAERILGLTLDQMAGRTSADPRWRAVREDGSPFPGEDHPPMVALRTGRPQRDVTMGVHRPDGSLVWLSVNAQPLLRPGAGRPTGVVSSFFDITQRRAAEAHLRASTEQLHLAAQSAGIGTWDYNPVTGDLTWDERCRAAFGLPPDAPVDYGVFLAGLHPDDRERADGAVRAILDPQSDGSFRVEYRTVSLTDGAERWILSAGRAYYDAARTRAERFTGIVIDITERKRAEEGLRQFQFLADSANDALYLIDEAGRFLYVNDAACRSLGYTAEQFRTMRTADVDFIYDDAAFRALFARAEGERLPPFESLQRRADGSALPVEASVTRFNVGGRPLLLSSCRDITERKRAEAERSAAFRREALLNRIGQAVRQAAAPEEVEQTALTGLAEALGADRCLSIVIDRANNLAKFTGEWRRDDLPPLVGDYPLSEFAVELAEIFPAGGTLRVRDTQTEPWSPQTAAVMARMRIRALLDVPLSERGEIVGALGVYMADEARQWTDEEVGLVEAVASQLRSAAEAARVRAKEHRIATDLQNALQPPLPDHVPNLEVASYTRPALEEASVGGDFYDLFPLDKELYALVIGDVSGKGLAAAQQLALIRNSLRTTLYLYRAPAQAAQSLNAIVTAHDLLLGFVTAFVGVYDAASGRITYASCGHEPGLIRRADGAVETLETTGLPLGASENALYGELTISLTPGDSLLLYTDGLSEAGPDRRTLLGTDGLARLLRGLPAGLPVQAEAEQLVSQVGAYAHGVFRDDVAVLLARR